MKVAVIDTKFENLRTSLTSLIKNFKNEGELMYDGSRNTVKSFKINNFHVVVKAFKPPHLINKISYRFFRKSKARRSYEYAQKLQELKIGTPAPIAYFENFSTFLFKDSYYISEYLESDLDYRDLIEIPNYPDQENILKQFAAFTKDLHDKGILFKDHSPGNTLIKNAGNGKYIFYLVDLNRMEFKNLSFEERISNFSKLTPKKEMVRIMAYTYAELGLYDKEEVFEKMWKMTEDFQNKYHKKRKIKRRVFFWKEKYK